MSKSKDMLVRRWNKQDAVDKEREEWIERNKNRPARLLSENEYTMDEANYLIKLSIKETHKNGKPWCESPAGQKAFKQHLNKNQISKK